MKALLLFVMACGTVGAAPATNLADVVAKLRDLDAIEPAAVAKLLGGKLGTTTDVTPYRHETSMTLAPFAEAKVVVGGEDKRWRIVQLVLDRKSTAKLSDLDKVVGKLPHSIEPRTVHKDTGLEIVGTSHHFRTAKLELIVDVNKADVIESIVLSTDQTVTVKP
jgi:hypothetical protein